MKEKKSKGARKVLLMGVACVLVAAISVGATLAYLTAKTNVKTNTFTASPGISGLTMEPNYDPAAYPYTIPGTPVPKDPLVQNTTEDADIVVGAKLSFYIDAGSGYAQVSQEVFSHYVDFKTGTSDGMNITGTLQADGTITGNSKKWITQTRADGDTKSTYLIYDTILKQQTGTQISAGTSNPANVSTYNDNKDDSDTALETNAEADNTAPIFTYVIPKKELEIRDDDTALTAVNGGETLTNVHFKKFNYKIIIDAYAVKDDNNLVTEAGGSTTASAKITAAADDIKAGLKSITHTVS